MPKIAYIDKRFSANSWAVIDQANRIIADYSAQGFDLTLRQLYYQFVARGLVPNRDSEYKRLGSVVNDARLAGLIDWNAIQDMTRYVRSLSHWDSPEEVIASAATNYRRDMWETQSYRPEVWIEKDALVGVISGVCEELDVPYFSCRGYTSQSEMWSAGQRLRRYVRQGQTPVILHLGDHDPSGIDMTRDITDRLALFMGGCEINRLALNMNQVRTYRPPPNPAKITDSRFIGYLQLYGEESWELDALEPRVLADLIRGALERFIDTAAWEERTALVAEETATLEEAARRWDEVSDFLS